MIFKRFRRSVQGQVLGAEMFCHVSFDMGQYAVFRGLAEIREHGIFSPILLGSAGHESAVKIWQLGRGQPSQEAGRRRLHSQEFNSASEVVGGEPPWAT